MRWCGQEFMRTRFKSEWRGEHVNAAERESDRLMETVERIIAEEADATTALRSICVFLGNEVPHYDWVGFYLVDPDNDRELVLGPYVGEPTEHTRIPFGRGICGQAAESGETFVVEDVREETNYLSCSTEVLSEIVVPIKRDGKVLGELDIDSHELAPFSEEELLMLERICDWVARIL